MNYNDLLIEVEHHDIIVKEKPLKAYDGRIKGNKIFIRSNLKETQKVCVLAEELGHHHTTVGNILDQSETGIAGENMGLQQTDRIKRNH